MKLTLSRRTALGSLAGAGVLASLAACSSNEDTGGGGEAVSPDDVAAALKESTELTFWTVLPDAQKAVDKFQAAYPEVSVEVVQVAGGDLAQNLRTAIEAGTGIPDVVQFPSSYVSSNFVVTENVLDLTPYGIEKYQPMFVEGAWAGAAYADGIWGFPQDTGPWAVMYRRDLLAQAGVQTFPATWDEFKTVAKTVRDATGAYLTNLAGSDARSLPVQGGQRPFRWDGGKELTVDTANDVVERGTAYWDDLIKQDLVSIDTSFTDAWYQGLSNGKYASWIGAAWGPIFLESTAASTSGQWGVAPIPQWDAAEPSYVNTGGSVFSIMKASQKPLAAYGFLQWLNADPAQFPVLVDDLGVFPAAKEALADQAWLTKPSEFFGGQGIKEVFAQGADFSLDGPNPVGVYADNSFDDNVTPVLGRTPLFDAYQAWGEDVGSYAQSQGFTIVNE